MSGTRNYLRAVRAAVRAVGRAREAREAIVGPDRVSLAGHGAEFQRADLILSQIAIRAAHCARTVACARCGGYGTVTMDVTDDVQACPAACDNGRVAAHLVGRGGRP